MSIVKSVGFSKRMVSPNKDILVLYFRQIFKSIQDEIMAPTDPKDMDDLQTKQFLVFLKTYATYFS